MEQVELKEVIDYTGVVRVEHRYSKEDDRWVYMEFGENDKLMGLNYCQGDDYSYFKENWANNDPNLMEYYNNTCNILKGSLTKMTYFELINLILWLSLRF